MLNQCSSALLRHRCTDKRNPLRKFFVLRIAEAFVVKNLTSAQALSQVRENAVEKFPPVRFYKLIKFESLGRLYWEAIRRQNIGPDLGTD